jgi:hypothetical protein
LNCKILYLLEMATQICPSCKKDSFTWSIDDEDEGLTRWGCYLCYYGAYEDEKLERQCSVCLKKNEMRLKDEEGEFWWCCTCNTIARDDQHFITKK